MSPSLAEAGLLTVKSAPRRWLWRHRRVPADCPQMAELLQLTAAAMASNGLAVSRHPSGQVVFLKAPSRARR